MEKVKTPATRRKTAAPKAAPAPTTTVVVEPTADTTVSADEILAALTGAAKATAAELAAERNQALQEQAAAPLREVARFIIAYCGDEQFTVRIADKLGLAAASPIVTAAQKAADASGMPASAMLSSDKQLVAVISRDKLGTMVSIFPVMDAPKRSFGRFSAGEVIATRKALLANKNLLAELRDGILRSEAEKANERAAKIQAAGDALEAALENHDTSGIVADPEGNPNGLPEFKRTIRALLEGSVDAELATSTALKGLWLRGYKG